MIKTEILGQLSESQRKEVQGGKKRGTVFQTPQLRKEGRRGCKEKSSKKLKLLPKKIKIVEKGGKPKDGTTRFLHGGYSEEDALD